MLRIFLVTALRSFRKNRVVSGINILCLSLGLGCAIMAIIFANHELTFENCHTNADNIARVYTLGKFGSIERIPTAFGKAKEDLLKACPEINQIARTKEEGGTVFKESTPFREENIMLSEKELYDILTFNFIAGQKPSSPNDVILSDKMARKYFGSENPVGKSIKIGFRNITELYTVSGVFEDFPSNSQNHKLSFVLPFELAYRINMNPDSYQSTEFNVYASCKPGIDFSKLNTKIASTIDIPVPIENISYNLVPIKRMHLGASTVQDYKGNFIALLIGGIVTLIITLFNFINSQTVLFSTRFKEIGIKKTVGGNKKNIILQFITESSLFTIISFALALLLVYSVLPHFNSLMDTQIELEFNWKVAAVILTVLLLTVLLSSLYPAIKSIRITSISLIRENSDKLLSKSRVSNFLVTTQFVIALLLIQFLIITVRQVNYMSDKDVLKFDSENVLCLDGWAWGNLNLIKEKLLLDPSIDMVSWGQALPGASFSMTPDWKEDDNQEMANVFVAESDYLNLFKIKMQDGRFFSQNYSSDHSNGLVINQVTANLLGFEDPIGKTVMVHRNQYQIIGITDSYVAEPPIVNTMPLLITEARDQSDYLLIRVIPELRSNAHYYIEKVLAEANPNQPLILKYYNDIVNEYAKTYQATGVFINVFTGIINFNAMLGLFALSFFISENKNKEIGIRKVCGAKTESVVWSLSRGFIQKLLIAFIISAPLGYVMGNGFLSTFTTRMELSVDIFLLGGVLAFVMVFISTGWKIWFTATRNPVNALKYE